MAETEKKEQTGKNWGAGIPKVKLDYSDPMLLLEVEGFARDGYDDTQIAEILGVSPETFSRNKKKRQSDGTESHVSQALKKGRRPLAVMVENALFSTAMGGRKVKTVTVMTKSIRDQNGNETGFEEVMRTETETELAPNVAAGQFWLKHHKADIYNPVIQAEIDHTTNGKDMNALPKILRVEHVNIESKDVKKIDADT